MSDQNPRNSELLDHLIEAAKGTAGAGGKSLTTVRLVLAALEECHLQGEDSRGAYGDEAVNTETALKKLSADPDQLLTNLRAYEDSDIDSDLTDSLALQIRMTKAREEAESQGNEILTADTVVCFIASDIPTALERAMRADSSESGKGTDSVGQDAGKYAQGEEDLFHERVSEDEAECVEKEEEEKNVTLAGLSEKTRALRRELSACVFGQDHAIQAVTNGYFRSEVMARMEKDRFRPRAIFLFAGPPGVGKTFLAENTARILGLPFARFDMSEYADPYAFQIFAGTDKNYKASAPGTVTKFVNEHPHCILLFDEIEKADIKVIHLFLQMLDAGRVQDGYMKKEISFKDALLIMTTNAGRPLYEEGESGNFADVPRKVILKALEKDVDVESGKPFFPAAICSRFATGNVVMFNHMEAHFLREIAKKEVLRQAKEFEEAFGITLDIDETVYTTILFSEGGTADARTIRSRAEMFLQEELYEVFRLIGSGENSYDINKIRTIRITTQLPREGKTRELFLCDEQQDLLVFAPDEEVRRCDELTTSYRAIGAQTREAAERILAEKDVRLILLDPICGRRDLQTEYINIEDMDSEARDTLAFVLERHREIPVYILETEDYTVGEEEMVSFRRSGVSGVVRLEGEEFTRTLEEFSENLHQQASMRALAKENRIVTYETGQTVSEDGSIAEIRLFDFALKTAVDADDSENIMSVLSKPNTRFDQVIGAQDAKDELTYFVNYLKNPGKFRKFGGHAPRGVILYGPPGTGKTMMAKAMAGEADVTFISTQGNVFLKRYVGEGPQKVHDMFRIARKYAPSILFIDEIDAIAHDRSSELARHTNDILTALLAEMDGFASDPSKPVFVLAATNCNVEPGSPQSLDQALMRRFDRRIYVERPDKENRTLFLKKKNEENDFFDISDDMINNLADRSTGMSLANLESVLDMAVRLAIRADSNEVTDALLDEAFETNRSGSEKKWDPAELERTARHEAGHAYVCWKGGDTPSYVSIVARGDHGGYVQHADSEQKGIYTKGDLLARIRTSLAGRAAEIVYYGEEEGLSTGASGDFESATHLAKQMLCTYGMDSEFGIAVVDGKIGQNVEIGLYVRDAVNMLLSREMEKTIQMIEEGRESMDRIVEELLDKNRITGKEMEECLKKR